MVHENLNGRVAVITGGGGVLCSGFAKDLAAQGVKVEEAVDAVEAKPAKKRTSKKAKEEVEAVEE